MAFALKANRCTPEPLTCYPVHTGHAAGIVLSHRLCSDHFHAGAVDVRQAGPPDYGRGFAEKFAVTAAGSAVTISEALGKNDRCIAALTLTQPCRFAPDVLCWGQNC